MVNPKNEDLQVAVSNYGENNIIAAFRKKIYLVFNFILRKVNLWV